MAEKFLSDAWFDGTKKLADSFGKIALPEKLVGLILNLNVTGGPEGDKEVHFTEGRFIKGYHADAKIKLTLSYSLCYKAMLQNDTKAAMKGFLTRQIKVNGNITEMLTLASVKTEGDLESFRVKTLEMTETVA